MRRFNRVHDDVELSEVKTLRFNNDENKYPAKYVSKYSKHGQASTTNVVPENTAGSLVPLEDNEPWKKWIFDPGSDVMIKWNRVFLITGMIALFIDPMYFYLFSIENVNEISCVKMMDWNLNVALTIFRTISDAFYVLHILFKFRTAFIAPSSRVFGRGELVTDTKQIAKRYLKTQFVIDLAAALPLPQIVSWLMIPGVKHLHPHQNNNTLSLIVLIQYIVRLYRIFPLSQQIINAAGVVTNTAWAGAAYNLLLYMIVSNVIGASYYLLTIDRQTTCWNSECRLENGTSGPPCKMEFLICDFLSAIDQTWANSTRVFANCNANDNSISFNFGIYENALTSGAVSTSFFRKYFYSLWWGLQSLCTFGQGLSPSTYIWETAFSSLIVLLGLVLFAHLISNMETYLQSLTVRLEEWRLRRRDTEQWMSHRQLPQELRDRIRRFVQYKWFATQGVDDDSLLQALPADLRRDIQCHLCLDLVRRVPFFSQMDDPLLDAICEHLVSSLNTEGSYIVREGDPVTEMLFVIRGKLESSTTNGGQTGFFNSIILRPGDFCGEELLSWALLSKPATSLPSSTRTVRALVEVEAFALRAEDLSSVAAQFRRLHSKKLQHTFRFYSHHWRTWAACFIQAAWRRYKRKMRKSISRIESLSFRPESSAAHESNSSHMEQIASTTSRRSSQGSKGGADMSKLRKPDEPDFSAGNYDYFQ